MAYNKVADGLMGMADMLQPYHPEEPCTSTPEWLVKAEGFDTKCDAQVEGLGGFDAKSIFPAYSASFGAAARASTPRLGGQQKGPVKQSPFVVVADGWRVAPYISQRLYGGAIGEIWLAHLTTAGAGANKATPSVEYAIKCGSAVIIEFQTDGLGHRIRFSFVCENAEIHAQPRQDEGTGGENKPLGVTVHKIDFGTLVSELT
jgi:hypothetical protein